MTAACNHTMYMFGCEITASSSSSDNFVKTHRKLFTNLLAHPYERDVMSMNAVQRTLRCRRPSLWSTYCSTRRDLGGFLLAL